MKAGKFCVVSSSCDAPSCFSRQSELGISGGQASLCRTNLRANAAAALYILSSFASCCSSLNAHDGTNRRTLPPSRWLNCSSKLSSLNLYTSLDGVFSHCTGFHFAFRYLHNPDAHNTLWNVLRMSNFCLRGTSRILMDLNVAASVQCAFRYLNKPDAVGASQPGLVQLRTLWPQEYVQMAGRAGRRGLDKFGTVVVVCHRDKGFPSEQELKTLMTGQSAKLESKFRLEYRCSVMPCFSPCWQLVGFACHVAAETSCCTSYHQL